MRIPKLSSWRKRKSAKAEELGPQPSEAQGELEFRTTVELTLQLPTADVRALRALGIPVDTENVDTPLLKVKMGGWLTPLYGRIWNDTATFRFNGGPKPNEVAALKAAQERLNSLPDYAVRLAETLSKVASKVEDWMGETNRWKTEVKTLKANFELIKKKEE